MKKAFAIMLIVPLIGSFVGGAIYKLIGAPGEFIAAISLVSGVCFSALLGINKLFFEE